MAAGTKAIWEEWSGMVFRIFYWESREREVDIVANVGLVVEFLGSLSNMAALADQFFCPFVTVDKERIFRMTYVGTMIRNGFSHLLLRIEREL